jgi:hypothetical protein
VAVKETICEAIAGKNLLRFNYHNYDRIVEPHLLGRDKAGDDILSAYLVGGFTESGGSRHWRRYLVKEIRFLTKLKERFDHPRDGYNPCDPWVVTIHCRLQ